jgi:hypothetical protein
MHLYSRLLPLATLALAQTTAVTTPPPPLPSECDDADPHTWWFVVGVLVLVVGLVLSFFIGYYVASTVTPTARYTPELPRYTTAAVQTLASFSALPATPEPVAEPPQRTSAKSSFSNSKLKPVVADDSPLDRFNLASSRFNHHK